MGTLAYRDCERASLVAPVWPQSVIRVATYNMRHLDADKLPNEGSRKY